MTTRRILVNRKSVLVIALAMIATVSLLPVFSFGTGDIELADFYACNPRGQPQIYFPKASYVHFNITVSNQGPESKDVLLRVSAADYTEQPIGSNAINVTIASNSTQYYIMELYVPNWTRIGPATAYGGIFSGAICLASRSAGFTVLHEDLIAPVVQIIYPENITYVTDTIPFVFSVDGSQDWVGYTLDGASNMTTTGNMTLTDLGVGSHSLTIYVNDTSGNAGFSNVWFYVGVVHDVAVIDVLFEPNIVFLGEPVDLTISFKNEGTMNESFNITIGADSHIIEVFYVSSLSPNAQVSENFIWDTQTATIGSYSIWASLSQVNGEVDLSDNTCEAGMLEIISPYDVGISDFTVEKLLIMQGWLESTNVTVANHGYLVSTVEFRISMNESIIHDVILILMPGENLLLTFSWNTSEYVKGDYSINVTAVPLAGETDISDNSAECWVYVTLLGDANRNFRVDMGDITALCKSFGTAIGNPHFDSFCDIDQNGRVDMSDIVIVLGNFGKS